MTVSGSGNAVTGGNVIAAQSKIFDQISLISTSTHTARQIALPVSGGAGAFVANSDASLAYVVTSDAVTGSPYVISEVDLATGSAGQTLTVAQLSAVQSPFLAIAPDDSALYAGGGQSPALVCKINLPAFTTSVCVTVPGEITSSVNGRTLAVNSDGTKLYISFAGYGLVEYDTAGLTVTRTLPGAVETAGSQELIYSAATNSVYVSYTLVLNQDQYQSDVSRIDLGSFTIAATEPMSFIPADIAVSPDGAELVAAGAPSGALVLNGTTLAPQKIIQTGLTQSVAVARR